MRGAGERRKVDTMTRHFQILVAVLLAAVPTGCRKGTPASPVTIDRYREVEDFTFINQNEAPVSRADLLGRVWVANFIFTSCGAECLVLSQRMSALQKRYEANPGVAFVSFSVDPHTDQPPRLNQYARTWQADAERWSFLTGSAEALDGIVKHSFLLPVARGPEEQAELIRTNFVHSNKFALVDRQGVVRSYVDGLESDAMERIQKVIDHLLAEAPAAMPDGVHP
jgi:protein SCO1